MCGAFGALCSSGYPGSIISLLVLDCLAMARVTVEDCLENVENRFELVMLASRRARSLRKYYVDPLVPEENDKHTVIALREIALGLVDNNYLDELEISEEEDMGSEEEIELNFNFLKSNINETPSTDESSVP